MNKEELRKKYKNIRLNIKDRQIKDKIIFDKLINNKHFLNSKMIATYVSFKDEVDTLNIIKECFKLNIRVCVPVVLNNKIMEFYEIDSLNDLEVKNKLGILEPKIDNRNIVKLTNINLFIVPGLCFDKDKNRIGYGGGYYDRYLLNSNAYKIGIGYKEQLIDTSIPTNRTDIALDEIITD